MGNTASSGTVECLYLQSKSERTYFKDKQAKQSWVAKQFCNGISHNFNVTGTSEAYSLAANGHFQHCLAAYSGAGFSNLFKLLDVVLNLVCMEKGDPMYW